MLVLALHTVEEVTAKVPFAVILLQDFVTSKKVPEEMKCRQVRSPPILPTYFLFVVFIRTKEFEI